MADTGLEAQSNDGGEQRDFSPNFTSYSVSLGERRSDGTIAVPAGGYTEGFGIWDGVIEIATDHEDHSFWDWLLKRWPYESNLNSNDIPLLKREYEAEKAS